MIGIDKNNTLLGIDKNITFHRIDKKSTLQFKIFILAPKLWEPQCWAISGR